MKERDLKDKAQPFQGGAYFSSLEDRNSPKQTAMRALFKAIDSKSPKTFVAALRAAVEQGWDMNAFIVQTNPDTWATLGAYLSARPSVSYGKLLLGFLDFPGVEVASQLSQPFPRQQSLVDQLRPKNAHPDEPLPGFGVQPLAISFLRTWGKYLPVPSKATTQRGSDDPITLHHLMAQELLSKLNALQVNWAAPDDQGNTALHLLVDRLSSAMLEDVLPILRTLGIPASVKNHRGQTAVDVGLERIEREAAPATKSNDKEIILFKKTLSHIAAVALNEQTPIAHAPSRSLRL